MQEIPQDGHEPMPESLRRKCENELRRFCDEAIPAARRATLRLSFRIEGSSATLYRARKEIASGWRTVMIGRFRYDTPTREWHLERTDETGGWHPAIQVRAARKLKTLLRAYERASNDVFWG